MAGLHCGHFRRRGRRVYLARVNCGSRRCSRSRRVPETRGYEVPTKAKSIPAPPSEDAVRHRAYLLWEADGRPDGQADHYWLKASEPTSDVAARPKARATAEKTAAALKSAKPKVKAAAAKLSAPAVKAKPAAKAPAAKASKKA
ncbi:MAG: DUF2934 domain-containing protein [Hyphomicrobiales bacterium]|nr:MAG: DUF2934 domain-containing protein [Hyphomicrobiales bacterium]